MESSEVVQLSIALKNMGIAFKELCEAVASAFSRIVEIAKEWIERKSNDTSNCQKFFLDLKRPSIMHQVMDRKPKHMIRKTIN